MTSTDPSPELLHALDEAAFEYGVVLSPANRVAISRRLGGASARKLGRADVELAFKDQGLVRLPPGFATAVVRHAGLLGRPKQLTNILVEYRQFAIDALSAEFGGGRSVGREESLRNNLRTYLTSHAEVEARTGRGKTDIYIPEFDTIIEVKIWTGQQAFDEGVEELGRYIHTKRPKAAVLVVFGDRDPLPAVAFGHNQPFAAPVHIEDLVVPVIVVPFEGIAPSKALRQKKARAKNGR